MHIKYSVSIDDTVTMGRCFEIQLTGPPAMMMITHWYTARCPVTTPVRISILMQV